MTLRAISATSRWFRRERHPSVNPPNLDVSSSLSLVKVSFKSSSFLGARSSIPERNIHAMSADSFSKTYLPTAGIHKSGRSAVAARVALNARRSWSRVIWSPTDSFFFAFFFSTSSFTSLSESTFGWSSSSESSKKASRASRASSTTLSRTIFPSLEKRKRKASSTASTAGDSDDVSVWFSFSLSSSSSSKFR